jgi:hypothetical protein
MVAASCVALALIAIARRRPGVGLAAVCLVGGANLTTQVLKYGVFARPDYGITHALQNSLPSGHTTVAASISCAAILVVGPAMRPLIALCGAAYTALTGFSTVVMAWHRPGDVIAAIAVVAAWTGIVTLADRAAGAGRQLPTRRQAPRGQGARVGHQASPAEQDLRELIVGLLWVTAVVAGVAAVILAHLVWPEIAGLDVTDRHGALNHEGTVRAGLMALTGVVAAAAAMAGAALAAAPPRDTGNRRAPNPEKR